MSDQSRLSRCHRDSLAPLEPLELNPWPSDCQIYDGTVSITKLQTLENIRVLNNPINDFLIIENGFSKQLNIQVVDLMGRVLIIEKSGDQNIQLETNDLNSGFYVLRVSDAESKQFYIQKLIRNYQGHSSV